MIGASKVHWFCIASLMLVLSGLSGCAEPDKTDVQRFVESIKRTPPNKKIDDPPKIQPYTPFTYTAQGDKDPFTVSLWAGDPDELVAIPDAAQQSIISCPGIRPDPNRTKEEMEKYSLGSLKMMGTLRMGTQGELWALVLAPDNVVHRVQKNHYLGNNHGRITMVTEQKIEITEIVQEAPTEKKQACWQERRAALAIVP